MEIYGVLVSVHPAYFSDIFLQVVNMVYETQATHIFAKY
jgi:hypothetical protein